MAGMNITETRLPQDGAIKDKLNGKDLDLRVSALPTKRGEKIVIRIMDYSMSLKGIEYLYFNETNYNKILKMLNFPNGIILVTGATGTGKSTTLYSFLQKLNVEGSNLITVEDPVEMDIKGVNQVQVNSDIGLDFATVLRSILRQDPNVIMIGEIRDSETAQIAVRASITGHLVLSTIHTNNSLNTIERLLDMDVERYLLSSALTGIISQKLARRLCPKCRVLRPTTDYEKEIFRLVLNKNVEQVYDAGKCDDCTEGYHGRIAIQEVLYINDQLRSSISNPNTTKDELNKLVYTRDVTTLLGDGLEKIIDGITTFSEIFKLIEVDLELKSLKKKAAEEFGEVGNEIVNTPPPVVNNPVNVAPPIQQEPKVDDAELIIDEPVNQANVDITTPSVDKVVPIEAPTLEINSNQVNNVGTINQAPANPYTFVPSQNIPDASDDQIIDIIDEPVNPAVPPVSPVSPIPPDPMHAYFNQTNNVN